MPVALVAPAGAEHREELVPHTRLYVERDRVTVGTAIALGQDIEKKDGCGDTAEDEESREDQHENHGV
jgi:hypothetical protein